MQESLTTSGCWCAMFYARGTISTGKMWGWNNKVAERDEKGLLSTALPPFLKDVMSLTIQETTDTAILGTGLFHPQNKVDLLCYFVPGFFAECR